MIHSFQKSAWVPISRWPGLLPTKELVMEINLHIWISYLDMLVGILGFIFDEVF